MHNMFGFCVYEALALWQVGGVKMMTERKRRKAGNEGVMTVPDVARELGIDESTVRRYILLGTLKALVMRAGTRNTYRVKREVFDAFVVQCETGIGA